MYPILAALTRLALTRPALTRPDVTRPALTRPALPRSALTRPDDPTHRPQITVTEEGGAGSQQNAILPQTSEHLLYHDLTAAYGARYSVSVQTTADDAVPAPAVTYVAPPIPGPHQLRPILEPNGTVTLYWKERRLPAEMKYVK